MSGRGKTGSSMPEGEQVEHPRPSQSLLARLRLKAKVKNMFSLCTCWGTIVGYDVLIPVTQNMSFVCKQTVRTVVFLGRAK